MDSTLYRPNVAAVLLSSRYPQVCEFFLAERIDIEGVWQFPQGGIDEGELPESALMRELREEIGTDAIEILQQFPTWLHYDFPSHLITPMRPYIGQKQLYFLARLLPDAKINLHTKHPEFLRYEFVRYEEILPRCNHFKRQVYATVLGFFANFLTNHASFTLPPLSTLGDASC